MSEQYAPPARFALTEAERLSPAWIHLRTHLAEKLQELRAKNDLDADSVKTAHVRGQIHQIKQILELDSPQKPIPPQDG